jgi:hypothetical protein
VVAEDPRAEPIHESLPIQGGIAVNGSTRRVGRRPYGVNDERRMTPRRKIRGPHDWCCSDCGALLGKLKGGRFHYRSNREHEYVASFPVTCRCRFCTTLNERYT